MKFRASGHPNAPFLPTVSTRDFPISVFAARLPVETGLLRVETGSKLRLDRSNFGPLDLATTRSERYAHWYTASVARVMRRLDGVLKEPQDQNAPPSVSRADAIQKSLKRRPLDCSRADSL